PAVGPMADVMPLAERPTAAREAAAFVAMVQHAPERGRNGPGTGADLFDPAIRSVPHHHPARVAGQAPRRFRGNVRAVLEDRLPRRLRVGQHRRIVRGRLAPEVGALLVQALAAAREALYQQARATETSAGPADVHEETPTLTQQQADALGLLAETALHHGIDPGAPGERYQVVVHVDAPVLADPEAPGQSVLQDGTHVSAETSQRLACDASRVVMRRTADGRVEEVGARTRTIPPALRRVLHHRDKGCRFP